MSHYKKEFLTIVMLALPMIANGILESSNGFTNVLFAARLGATQLAANVLVSGLFVTLMVIVWGFISAVSITIAHYHGAQNDEGIAGSLQAGAYLSLIISIPMMTILWFSPLLFQWTGQSPLIIKEARQYLHALTWAIPFDLLGFTLMQLFTGIAKPKITLAFSVFYLPFMVLLNNLFVFGHWGFPQLGLAGLGWGTTIAYVLTLIFVSIFISRKPQYRYYWQMPITTLRPYFKELLSVGLPLGFTFCIEISFFFVLALLMGKINGVTLASFQIVMQYFWIFSTVVFSFGQALTIRLSWRLGRREPQWLVIHFIIGQLIAITYGLFITLSYWLLARQFIRYDLGYLPNWQQPLVQTTVKFFKFAALFQFLDNMRTICLSVLRGLKDTRFALLMAIATFWLLALPLGYYIPFHGILSDGVGLWLSASSSVALASIIMLLRLKYLRKRLLLISS